jgi:hypothetical protein
LRLHFGVCFRIPNPGSFYRAEIENGTVIRFHITKNANLIGSVVLHQARRSPRGERQAGQDLPWLSARPLAPVSLVPKRDDNELGFGAVSSAQTIGVGHVFILPIQPRAGPLRGLHHLLLGDRTTMASSPNNLGVRTYDCGAGDHPRMIHEATPDVTDLLLYLVVGRSSIYRRSRDARSGSM